MSGTIDCRARPVKVLGLGGVPRWEEGKRPVQIAAGGAHSVAVLEDGGVLTWGCDNFGQVVLFRKVPFTVTLCCKYTWALTGGGAHGAATISGSLAAESRWPQRRVCGWSRARCFCVWKSPIFSDLAY
jgi:hypothetical protein